jgi:hypothetical protein
MAALCHSCTAACPRRTRFYYSQKMRSEHHHLLRVSRISDVDGPVGVRILVGADSFGEHVRECFSFTFFLRRVGQWSVFWMECLSHQLYAIFCIAVPARFTYRLLDCAEGR